MNRILIRLFIFCLPLIILIGFGEWKLCNFRESVSVARVIEEQLEDEREPLFMRGILSQDFNIYKMSGIKYVNPEILVIGSSRVMQFRSFQFNPSYSFYNAGGVLQCAEDLDQFVSLLADGSLSKPELLIVGLDPWWYKADGLPNATWLSEEKLVDDALEFSQRIKHYKKLFTNYQSYGERSYKYNYGVYAQKYGGGFRPDGSKANEQEWILEFIENPVYVDRENPPVVERIANSTTNRFTLSKPDSARITNTLASIHEIIGLDIDVVVIAPALSSECYNMLLSMDVYKDWIDAYTDMLIQIDSFGVSVIHMAEPSNFNLDDTYFIDGFHPGEVMIGVQLEQVLSEDKTLSRYINSNLSALNRGAVSPLTYYFPK